MVLRPAREALCCGEPATKPELFHAGTVKVSQEKMLIVLDSGADCSVLPKAMASRGQPQDGGGKAILEDAQGTQLKTYGRKLAQVERDLGMAGSVIIKDDFLVASVQTPLVSLFRLLQRGWRLTQGNCEAGVNLVAPDQKCEIPLYFKKNNLALYGCINRVSEGPEEVQGEINVAMVNADDNEVLVVMTVVKLNDSLWEFYGLNAWRTMAKGNPINFKYHSKNFENAQLMWNLRWWPLRSTLIRRWWRPGTRSTAVATTHFQILKQKSLSALVKKPVQCFGTVVGERTATAGGANVESSDFFLSQNMIPVKLGTAHCQCSTTEPIWR